MNANSIRHGFNSAKSPTRSTISLVSDFFNRRAIWPCGSGVESCRDRSGNSDIFVIFFEGGADLFFNSTKGFDVEVGGKVLACNPLTLDGVDVFRTGQDFSSR